MYKITEGFNIITAVLESRDSVENTFFAMCNAHVLLFVAVHDLWGIDEN